MWLSGKESACQCRRHRFSPWVRKTPEKVMATHSSILAWEIQRAEKPGGLQQVPSCILGTSGQADCPACSDLRSGARGKHSHQNGVSPSHLRFAVPQPQPPLNPCTRSLRGTHLCNQPGQPRSFRPQRPANETSRPGLRTGLRHA